MRLPDTNRLSWLVLDDDYVPVQPILAYLTFLHDLDRSPNTIRTVAHHLKQFWEYLRDLHLCWTDIDVAQLAGFITWLRRRDPAVISIEPALAKRTNTTIDQILGPSMASTTFTSVSKPCQNFPCIACPCLIDAATNHSCTALPRQNQSTRGSSPPNVSGGCPRR